MIKNNTISTQKKLAFMFSVIVGAVVFVLSLFMYSAISHGIKHDQFNKFEGIVGLYENGKNTLSDYIFIEKKEKNNKKQIFGEINYLVLDNDDNLISNYIISDIDDENYENIIKYRGINVENIGNYLVKNVFEENRRVIFIYKSFYTIENMLIDISSFFIIAILTGIIVYFISRFFIKKVFIPVEENIKNKNAFIHNAGHELQTPLAVIVSNIDFYKKSKVKDEEILNEIKHEALKMGNLIKSLLNLSSDEKSTTIEEFKISDLIENIIKNYEKNISNKNIQVINNISKESLIKKNKEHLSVCLSNIIGNAIKYNKNNGEIKIEYNKGEIKINDTGIGINQKNLIKIFDRFYKEDKSRNSDGFGIGLSLVKKICEENNWTIKVESEVGIGTTFFINI